MTLIETLIAGLVIAFVTAITWLAYHHQHAYRKISIKIELIICAVMIALFSYNSGVSDAKYAVANNIKDYSVVIKAIEAKNISIFWPFIIALSLLGYLIFLACLPYLLKKEE